MIVIYLVLIGVSQVHSSYQKIVSYNLLNTNLYCYFDLCFDTIKLYYVDIVIFHVSFIYCYKTLYYVNVC